MGFRRTSLLLCILFIFHLQQNSLSVSSRPSSVDTNYETLPSDVSEPLVVGKSRELAVVIKKGFSGGGRGGGGSSRGGGGGGSSSSVRGGGGTRSRSRGGAGVIAAGGSHSRHSSGSTSLGVEMRVVGWLGLSVLAGLFLV
ncbi:unnamed protein product [Microthlaspi erraticum]|uniref:Glycine-rich protein n=1 Tax=Microthlaspi erraticum TaxID=1685480 RepID=A0A6D2II74_9BRAS|nr:unnamed protein product [Microthlaspi erraticum]